MLAISMKFFFFLFTVPFMITYEPPKQVSFLFNFLTVYPTSRGFPLLFSFLLIYSQLSPVGHLAIMDTPIIRTATKSLA